ncbi:MAG TPA: hypothetical protein VJ481_03645 [Patescibacteria group bacterium]|uniref:Peptidase M14 carboxypeptidase A domain-containing protein n=1 Tax=Candidatus Woesebacteria bacterium RBG_13_46_13 TaxID=1802479 RepID=A0A1F7X3K6_9BACT|nr:MAG: hypothetical protein A2Y68_03495 [Candidatus Woesebacteria bacterium RBG_13_46_13]HJX59611.1 hypothetical protein [Patescibacteria group bacterium]
MNVVKGHLDSGLRGWKDVGAKVTYLKRGGIQVPEIYIPSSVQSNKLLLIVSGFHLEETSGPLLLLNSGGCSPLIAKILEKMNVLIFPVINQYGLAFDEAGSDKFLRYNQNGINFNTAWGFKKEKCKEVEIVEPRLIELHNKYQIVFVLSLHEDSTEPGKGYLWINNVVKDKRMKIQTSLESKVDKKILLQMKSTVGLREGKIEKGFSVIDAKDESFENFTSEILGIPTLVSEAPFGLDLETRMAFHKASLSSLPL